MDKVTRRGHNKACVALANKNEINQALLAKKEKSIRRRKTSDVRGKISLMANGQTSFVEPVFVGIKPERKMRTQSHAETIMARESLSH